MTSTMELNIWNEHFLLGDEWELDSPVDPSDGLLGDLKPGCPSSDILLGFESDDAVEHVLDEPYKDTDFLGMEWMESSDLGSFLGTLDNSHDKLLLLEANPFHCTSVTASEGLAIKELAVKDEPISIESSLHRYQMHQLFTTHNYCDASETTDCNSQISDVLLSPPSSPDQVAPNKQGTASVDVKQCNKVETYKSIESESLNFLSTPVDVFASDNFESVLTTNLFEGLAPVCEGDKIVTIDGLEFMGSPLSVDYVESMLSSSFSSPMSTSQNDLIESSPELYRVITSSIEGSKKLTSSKSKGHKQLKGLMKPWASKSLADHPVEQLNKKDRKKLQNKNAAIRYRMKKKEAAAEIKSEEEQLEDINEHLKIKVDDLQREIKYMKNLMEDVCRAKGLI